MHLDTITSADRLRRLHLMSKTGHERRHVRANFQKMLTGYGLWRGGHRDAWCFVHRTDHTWAEHIEQVQQETK